MELIPIMDGQNRTTSCRENLLKERWREPRFGTLPVGAVGAFVVAAALGSEALAAPAWQYTFDTSAAFTLTDNVLLSETDLQTDFITSLTGGIDISSETRAGSVSFNYQLGYDHYIDTDELNGMRHNLMTQNNFVLADDFLFLDVRASVGERSIRRSLRTPGTSRTINGDQSMVLVGAIAPYVETTIKDRVGVKALVEYSLVDFRLADVSSGGAQPDGDSRWRASFGLRSLDRDQRIGWELSADSSSDDDDLERQSIGGVVRFRVRENVRLLARGGYDATSGRPVAEDIDDVYWRGGIEMEPITNSKIRLEAGERYGEPSYDAEIRYEFSKALRVVARYEEALQTDNSQFSTFLNAWEAAPVTVGIRFIDPNSPYFGLDFDGDIFDQLTLNNTARVTLSGGIGRIVWSLDGSYRTREFAELDGIGGPYEEEMKRVSLQVSRSFGRRTQVSLSGRYEDEESDLPTLGVGPEAVKFAQEIDVTTGQMTISYALSPTAEAALNLTTSSREDETGASVDENVVMLTVTKSW